MADVVAALVALLKAQAPVAALVGQDIFGGELPPKMTARMPARAIVLAHSGGTSLTAGSFAEFDTVRVDLFAHGETPSQAVELLLAGSLALRRARRGVWPRTGSGMLIHWVSPAGGPMPARDSALAWPRAFQPFQVMHALEPVESGP